MFNFFSHKKELQEQIRIVSESEYFDRKWYLKTYPDIAALGIDPAKHYLKHGWIEGRNPSLKFSTIKYLNQHPECTFCPLLHYTITKKYEDLKKIPNYNLLSNSRYFDKKWYLNTYKDVKKSKLDPIEHYLTIGWEKGYNPSKIFNNNSYLKANTDVKEARINPLVHFLLYGQLEGRNLKPTSKLKLFFKLENACNRTNNSVIKAHDDNYMIIANSPFFDSRWYKEQNPGILMDPIDHYLTIGWKEGKNPSEEFDNQEYLNLNEDVRSANMPPLLHWELFGKDEGRPYKVGAKSISGIYQKIKEGLLDFETIKALIANKDIKIISFDIFDTLLIRPAINPTDIFYLIDAKLKKEKDIDFIKYRLHAETELCNQYATLDMIYKHIKKKHRLSDDIINIMKQEELECERALLSKREDIHELYKYAMKLGKKIIAVSDMYLSSDFLKKVLSQNGYKDIQQVYVSNEYQARKDDGSLYEIIQRLEKTTAILHIGDNYISDYQKAIEKNTLAVYYPSIKDFVLSENSIYSSVWDPNISKDPMCRLALGFTLNYYFKNINKIVNQEAIFANFKSFIQLGIAPLIFHIANRIANNSEIQNNYTEILFASRDGYLPKLGYDIYCKYQNCRPSKYIYAGRRAYFSTKYETFSDYVKTIEVYKQAVYTIKDLLTCHITDKVLVHKILTNLTKEEKELDFAQNKDKVISVLQRFEALLNPYYLKHRENSKKYYENIMSNSNRGVVFDCGYSGSISDNITNVIQKPIDKIYLWETQENKKKDKKNNTKTFLLMNENRQFITQHLIYEEIFSPLEGGCLGFENNKPLLEKLPSDKKMKELYEIIYKKTEDYMNKICSLFRSYLPYISIQDTKSLQALLTFAFTQSPFNELSLLDSIQFPDPVFMNDVESLSYKVQKYFNNYDNVFSQTGFNNPRNKIHLSPNLKDNNLKIGIHIHLYHIYLYNEFIYYLKDFPQKFDLVITISDQHKERIIKNIFNKDILPNLNNLILIVVENRGRDVAPWIIGTRDLQKNYDLFCHVQSKISTHIEWGNEWRKYILKNLLDKTAVINMINIFIANQNIGVLFPKVYYRLKELCIARHVEQMGMFGEEAILNDLLKRMHYNKKMARKDLFFSEGTMQWYRPKALAPLFDLNLKLEEFPPEPIGVGGTIAHAIERLPALVCTLNGYLSKEFTTYDEGTEQ